MRSLPDPDFAGDTGEAQPDLVAALGRFASEGARSPVLEVLSSVGPATRLLVPVVASSGRPHGATDDGQLSDGDVATVLLRGRDSRLALLAFTSLDAIQAWDVAARPVPVTARAAAEAALGEGAGALLLDVAGPVAFAVETAELSELAKGRRLLPTPAGYAWFTDWLGPTP